MAMETGDFPLEKLQAQMAAVDADQNEILTQVQAGAIIIVEIKRMEIDDDGMISGLGKRLFILAEHSPDDHRYH